MNHRGNLSRRSFLQGSVTAFAMSGAFGALSRRLLSADAGSYLTQGYGPLQPVKDATTGLELLCLPAGFSYSSFGWKGEMMSDGIPTPAAHDGMAVISQDGGRIILCRNHEVSGNGVSFGPTAITYDPKAPGGCSNLEFDASAGKWVKAWASISGTSRNCAGGPTPWGTWLTCEEITFGPGDVDGDTTFEFEKTHGWILEVPAEGTANPIALEAMGRMWHEAIAVDPATGIVYETEDRTNAGLFRFIPAVPGKLAEGGQLQMLKVAGRDQVVTGLSIGDCFDTSWVDIDDPHLVDTPGTKDHQGLFHQGTSQGGVTFNRLEGAEFNNGRIYVTSTEGGNAGKGQLFEYHPVEETLTMVFESPSGEVLDMPDNMTVSPRGGIVLCEDGEFTPQRIHGLTSDGKLFPFAANNVVLAGEVQDIAGDFRNQEWCGATFSHCGNWLFVNIQTPGITFAVTGPWQDGLI